MDLTTFDRIVGGGLLAGKKTYLAAGLLALTAVVNWLAGDMALADMTARLVEAFGLAGLRAGIAKAPVLKLRSAALGGVAALALAALVLPGCAATLQDEAPDTPQGRLLALEADFNTAFVLMRQYEGLPRCDATETPICSEQEAVDRLRLAVISFDEATETAWAILRDPAGDAGVAQRWISRAALALSGAAGLVGELRAQGVIGQ